MSEETEGGMEVLKMTKAQLEKVKLGREILKLDAETADLELRQEYMDLCIAEKREELADAEASLENQRIVELTSEVSEASVRKAIFQLGAMRVRSKRPVTLRISSPGGDAIAGLALYDYIQALRVEGIKVTTVALGWAASMAGVLLQAGDVRLVGPNAFVLIHEVSSWAGGKTTEIEDELAFVKKIQARLLAILAERSSLSPRQVESKWKRKDWWLTAEELIKLGFADGLYPPPRKKADAP